MLINLDIVVHLWRNLASLHSDFERRLGASSSTCTRCENDVMILKVSPKQSCPSDYYDDVPYHGVEDACLTSAHDIHGHLGPRPSSRAAALLVRATHKMR